MNIEELLTPDELERAKVLWQALKDTGQFAKTLEREIVTPNLARIRAALGEGELGEYQPLMIAYAVENVFEEADQQTPGRLWEWAEDTCKVCSKHLGWGVRFMHVGLCETCNEAPKH